MSESVVILTPSVSETVAIFTARSLIGRYLKFCCQMSLTPGFFSWWGGGLPKYHNFIEKIPVSYEDISSECHGTFAHSKRSITSTISYYVGMLP